MSKTRYVGTLLIAVSVLSVGMASAQAGGSAIPRRLSLLKAEEMLRQRNLAVAAERFQVDASRAARLIAGYKPNPLITVSAEQFALLPPRISTTRQDRFLFLRTDQDAAALPSYSVSVEKLIERGGKREARMAEADSQLEAAEARMLDVMREELFELRTVFVRAMLARENQALAERMLHDYGRILTLTTVRVEAGDAPGAELYRVRAGELQFQQASLETRIQYDRAVRDVLNLLGARPEDLEAEALPVVASHRGAGDHGGVLLEIEGDFVEHPVVASLKELRRIAVANRPDVLVARHELAAASSGLRLARSLRSRDLAVSAGLQRVGSDSTFGVAFQVPLFVHHNYSGAISRAEAQRRSAETQLRRAELRAVTDVGKAYQEYLGASRVLEVYNLQNLDHVERMREVAVFTHREGAASMFELLDSQRVYNQAIQGYNEARANYQISLHRLEHAVGVSLR